MKKIIATTIRTHTLNASIKDTIINYTTVNRSDEGKRQGAWIFEKSEDIGCEQKRAVLKIHRANDIESVLIGNKLMTRLGLEVPVSFSISESDSDMHDSLKSIFLDNDIIEDNAEKLRIMKQLSSGSGVSFLMMEFVSQTTFSDLLNSELDVVISTPTFWEHMGKALLADCISGNEDRLLELNTGNWMIDKESCQLMFIDNEIVKQEKPELLSLVKNIVLKLDSKQTITKVINNIFEKFNLIKSKRDINSYADHMYRGFLTGYVTLGNSFLRDTPNNEVEKLLNKRISSVFSETTAKRSIITSALKDIGSGDINRLNLLLKSIKASFSSQTELIDSIETLITLKKEYKSNPQNRTSEKELAIKATTVDIINVLNQLNI